MPSDALSRRALEAMAERADLYRSALVGALSEMQSYVAAHRAQDAGSKSTSAGLLGRFAVGRIDVERFNALLTDVRLLAPESALRIGGCTDAVAELLGAGDELFACEVAPGGDLRGTVDAALSRMGRLFGAVRAFQAVKAGTYRVAEHEPLLLDYPFAKWNRMERDLAPPLVISVEGADLRAESLSEYLDGAMRVVLLVRGAASPAPLVRLLSPGTFVLQASDAAALDQLAGFTGPVAAAIVPPGCTTFVHDPRRGTHLEERLAIGPLPRQLPRHALGYRSARQQDEELAQLAALNDVMAAAREVSVVVVPPLPGGLPASDGARAVDAVASWMLAQAGFEGGAA